MRTVRNISLVVAIALLFTGCQTIKQKDMQDTLSRVLHNYELTTRWGKLSQVYSFLTPELAAQAKIQDNLNNVRVTSYEVVQRPASIASNSDEEVMQSVHIRYIYSDRQVEKDLIDHQQWKYNEDKREWRRNNPIPSF
jgi:hypothetical protein